MPRIKSSVKDVRRTKRRRAANRTVMSRLKSAIRTARTSKAGEDQTVLLRNTIKIIDKTVQSGHIHRNAAARYKSRLLKAVQPAAKA
jgi:small subunit ribosomal protein S20